MADKNGSKEIFRRAIQLSSLTTLLPPAAPPFRRSTRSKKPAAKSLSFSSSSTDRKAAAKISKSAAPKSSPFSPAPISTNAHHKGYEGDFEITSQSFEVRCSAFDV